MRAASAVAVPTVSAFPAATARWPRPPPRGRHRRFTGIIDAAYRGGLPGHPAEHQPGAQLQGPSPATGVAELVVQQAWRRSPRHDQWLDSLDHGGGSAAPAAEGVDAARLPGDTAASRSATVARGLRAPAAELHHDRAHRGVDGITLQRQLNNRPVALGDIDEQGGVARAAGPGRPGEHPSASSGWGRSFVRPPCRERQTVMTSPRARRVHHPSLRARRPRRRERRPPRRSRAHAAAAGLPPWSRRAAATPVASVAALSRAHGAAASTAADVDVAAIKALGATAAIPSIEPSTVRRGSTRSSPASSRQPRRPGRHAALRRARARDDHHRRGRTDAHAHVGVFLQDGGDHQHRRRSRRPSPARSLQGAGSRPGPHAVLRIQHPVFRPASVGPGRSISSVTNSFGSLDDLVVVETARLDPAPGRSSSRRRSLRRRLRRRPDRARPLPF